MILEKFKLINKFNQTTTYSNHMVERTTRSESTIWSTRILTNVALMLPPEESITQLKLWSVSKNFNEAVNIATKIQ